MNRFIDWFLEDPFWNAILILGIASMTSCTARNIVHDWSTL